MLTNTELNEAVAKRLGWVQCCNPGTMENGKIVDCFGWSKGGSHFHEVYPDYSGSIEAAFEIPTRYPTVVYGKEVFGSDHTCYFKIIRYRNDWLVGWQSTYVGGYPSCCASAKTAEEIPRAICEAFLNLRKYERQKL